MEIKHYNGLSTQEVNERIQKGLINITDDNISKSKKQIVLEHSVTYFNILNLFLAGIILSTGLWKNLTFVIVVFTNTIIGIYQEFKVKKLIDQLSLVTVKKVQVIRDGTRQEIPIENLVIDDIVYLESGNQIGTDCRVLDSFAMEVNESMLTGESEPVKKHTGDELLSGSFIVSGSGYACVKRIGKDNYSAQLVHKAKHKNKASSEMRDSIEKVIKVLSVVIIPVGIVLYMSQRLANPTDSAIAIVRTVGGIVGMIPEGLVLLTSLSFIIGVGKLARKKALIQEMEAIEALARINVLCLDKTGTITTGELEVEDVVYLNDESQTALDYILGAFCHVFENANSTQLALQKYFSKNDELKAIHYIPFSSKRKLQAIGFSNGENYVLGAPEYLLSQDDQKFDLVKNYSSQGFRVLLFGQTSRIDDENMTIGDVKALALIVLKDCIRDDAKETLAFFEKEGVDVRILSGDYPATISRVAQLAGLHNANRYIDATTLPDNVNDIVELVKYYRIFGRVKPEQKQLIIQALQKSGYVVGMVGDGVNDVLAIKDADCGIAMASGSDAAKQAAHIVLLDSCFASMKQIVNEGKTIIANIERVSSLYLTKTIYSTVLCLVFAILRRSYPFTPLQLSLISGLAIGIPSFALTLEQSYASVSKGFLRHVIFTAVPCALTMIIYMILITYLGDLLNFSSMMYSTYYYLVAGFISFLTVFIVCAPITKLRLILATSVTTLFYLIVFVLHDFFGIYSFLDMRVIWVIPICISAVFIVNILTGVIRQIYNHYSKSKSSTQSL